MRPDKITKVIKYTHSSYISAGPALQILIPEWTGLDLLAPFNISPEPLLLIVVETLYLEHVT